VAHDVPAPHLVRRTCNVLFGLVRGLGTGTLSVLHLPIFVEHAIERGLGGDVLPAVGQRGHNLARALVAKLC
jgi:hypothetical protein